MITPYTTEYAIQEFLLHGEYQLMQKLSALSLYQIFDIGCNIGEWSRMARSFHPSSHIHMFELVPETFQGLLRNNVIDELMYPNSYGLSDELKLIDMQYVPDNDRVSTTVMRLHHDNSYIKRVPVVPAHVYIEYHNIDYIDYIKIDTEGHEFPVLMGLLSMIESKKIACIQFEYGIVNILTKYLLIDFYELFGSSYKIGKITPEGVIFKPYSLHDETFSSADYLVVCDNRPDIIELVSAQ